MSNGKKYYYIYEQCLTPKNSRSSKNIEILQETVVNNKSAIKFRSNLMEADVRNQNKRTYDTSICETIVQKLLPKARSNSLLSEIDHPMFVSEDPKTLQRRSTIVELANCAALIKDLRFVPRTKQIIGEMQTLTGFKGPDLANIIRDQVDIGFSLRALGSVQEMSDGSVKVVNPIVPITFDTVSNPSFTKARVMELLPESLVDFISPDQDMLYECDEFREFLESESIDLSKPNDNVQRFINDIINENFLPIISKQIYFKIG